jgi:O-antigen/teichoic acid export membrane protein
MSLEGILNIISKSPGFEILKNIFLQIGYRQYSRVMSSPLWKGVFVIGSGTALAQAIGIASTPIITRLYNPADFGLLGIYSSILTILLVITSVRYEFAIPIPKNSSRAANILVLCIVIILGTTGLLSISFLLAGSKIMGMLGLADLVPYLWLIVIGFFGGGIYQTLRYWAIRQRDYPRITRTVFNQSLGGSLSKILFGLLSFGPPGLILGHIISNVAGIYTFIMAIMEKDRDEFRDISVTEIRSVAREHRSFPMYSASASLLLAVSLQIPVFMLTVMYGLDVVGWYTLAYQMLALPISLIAGSMSLVFYGEAAKSARENPETLRHLYLDTTKRLALIGFPVVVIIAVAAPWLFPIVFGESWRGAGILCLPLALVAIPEFIISPTNKLAVYGFNHWQLLFHIFRISLIAVGFYIAFVLSFSVVFTLILYGSIVAVTYIVLFILNIKAIDIINH